MLSATKGKSNGQSWDTDIRRKAITKQKINRTIEQQNEKHENKLKKNQHKAQQTKKD